MTSDGFDVFLSHNSSDKPAVRQLAGLLRERELTVWLDEDELRPGFSWQIELEKAIKASRAAAVLVGKDGIGPWEDVEMRAFLRRAVSFKIPVIPVLLPGASAEPELPMFLTEHTWVDLRGGSIEDGVDRLVWGITDKKPQRELGRPAPRSGGIAVSRLPRGAEVLVGRGKQLRQLTRAWNDPKTHVVSIVAWGGVGKTALAAEWMTRFAERDFEGVDAYFDWSFYSQGTRELGAASADLFIAAALEHFGDPDPQAGSPYERGERLAGLVAQGRTLLILDGLEPLQHGPGPLHGQLKDPALGTLLKGLAQLPFAGLCVLTSREPVADLDPFHAKTVAEWELEHLSEEAGAELLHRAGANRAGEAPIQRDDRELREACKEVRGHALTLELMGGYLGLAHDGDIRKRDLFGFTEADAEVKDGHAFRVLKAYERWLGDAGGSGLRVLAIVRLMGLFDRAADPGCLAALRAEPAIEGLTDGLAGLNDTQWNIALARVEEIGLVTRVPFEARAVCGYSEEVAKAVPAGGALPEPEEFRPQAVVRGDALEAHPLVREYFAGELRESQPEAWLQGHRRVYEHLCASVPYWPEGLDGLQPLYQAVAHGCQAGLQQKACKDVYSARILRGTGPGGNYSTFKLGAIGADLGAVACFFKQPWSGLSPNLSPDAQAWLLNEAAYSLRAVGRLTEAVEPMRAGLEMRIEQENWKGAAIIASNLGELELTLGRVSAAVSDGEQAVTFADRSGDAFQRMGKRTTHADALHQAGRREESLALFGEAEAMQAEDQPEYPRLYSFPGFRYCDVLLADAERAAWWGCRVVARDHAWDAEDTVEPTEPTSDDASKTGEPAEQTRGWKQPSYDLHACAAACDKIAERATDALGIVMSGSRNLLDIALNHLTLGRAGLYRAILDQSAVANHSSSFILDQSTTEHLSAAVDGLRQAGMMDDLPRGLLTRAWLRFLEGDESGCGVDLDEAQQIAERGSMRLHLADVQLTRARLFGDREALAVARQLIDDHGYHRRDQELADAEEMMGDEG